MSRYAKPFTTPRRNDSKTFQLTLNNTCGLPHRVCAEWHRRSFQDLPDELAQYRNPKTKATAEAGAFALINYLKEKQKEGSARRISVDDITVGAWLEKFTSIDTSPRTGLNVSKNRPYSNDSIDNYESYFRVHIKGDPLTKIKMVEIEEEDALEFITRMSIKKITDGRQMGGTRTFAGLINFVRMAFLNYQKIQATSSITLTRKQHSAASAWIL